MELTDAHLGIIRYLRDRGGTHHARMLTNALEEKFARMGGHRFLYSLFPMGPIAQASRYAGLPIPPGTRDPSFGSMY
ncbi:MAG TPA: TusE/DsrC/DsvC family sulfur relay protein [Thiobacillus sp.]|nr:TusE/DsrC/DsvC family sulfur relay protein [Thiobacillus sp.]